VDKPGALEPANISAPEDGRTPAPPAIERQLFEAMALCESHEIIEPALLKRLLVAKEPDARAYAAGVVARWADRLDQPLELLAALIRDEHPRVRLAAVVAAANIPGARSVDLALQAVEQPVDKFTALALKQAVFAQKTHWLPALTAGTLEAARHPARLELQGPGQAERLPYLPAKPSSSLSPKQATLRTSRCSCARTLSPRPPATTRRNTPAS
jgi:hypothetical protein